jgi:hypothetical protein
MIFGRVTNQQTVDAQTLTSRKVASQLGLNKQPTSGSFVESNGQVSTGT